MRQFILTFLFVVFALPAMADGVLKLQCQSPITSIAEMTIVHKTDGSGRIGMRQMPSTLPDSVEVNFGKSARLHIGGAIDKAVTDFYAPPKEGKIRTLYEARLKSGTVRVALVQSEGTPYTMISLRTTGQWKETNTQAVYLNEEDSLRVMDFLLH